MCWVHERFGIKEIRINQTGIQHSHPEVKTIRPHISGWSHQLLKLTEHLLSIAPDSFHIFSTFPQSDFECSVTRVGRVPIRQPGVMSGGKVGKHAPGTRPEPLFGQRGSSAGMVDPPMTGTVILGIVQAILTQEIGLKGLICLPNVVKPTCVVRPVRGKECGGKARCLRRNLL